MSAIRFKPFEYRFVDENDESYSIAIIALYKEECIIKLTTYQRFVGDIGKSKHFFAQNKDEVRRVCNFLNYALIDNYAKYKSKCLSDIKFNAVSDYIIKYATTKTKYNEYPSIQSIVKERNAVCMFMHNLSEELGEKEHYYARKIKSKIRDFSNISKSIHNKSESYIWEYEIAARYMGKHEYRLVRDIPQKAISYILKWVKLKEPELYFGVILQLCAGLREGEVVNIRRADSIYPGGIRITKENGQFTSFEVDLSHEYMLRSDGINIGQVKIKRKQQVYTVFLPVVQAAYEQHLKLMSLKTLEKEKPLFVNSYEKSKTKCNMALTERSYCNRISNIMVNYVIPELLKSEDPELIGFAMNVTEGSWGLHAFRHWFTVQLVLNNEDANSIASWRGDSSTKTAFAYLQNKGVLMHKYTEVTNKVSDYIISVVKDMEIKDEDD